MCCAVPWIIVKLCKVHDYAILALLDVVLLPSLILQFGNHNVIFGHSVI
jgi:hypothetical protein